MRHSTGSAGSAVEFTAVLLPADASIGQEYHKVVQDNSTQQLQMQHVLEKQRLEKHKHKLGHEGGASHVLVYNLS